MATIFKSPPASPEPAAEASPYSYSVDDILFHLGTATGYMRSRNHTGAAELGQSMDLTFRAACGGIGIFGSPGEGKSISVIFPLTYQALAHPVQCGVLAYDIKGNFGDRFLKLCKRANRKGTRIGIGPGAQGFNAIGTLSPSAAGNCIAQYMARGAGAGNSGFFIKSSSQLLEASLALLLAQPKKYNLYDVRLIPMNEEERAEAIKEAHAAVDAAKANPPTDLEEIVKIERIEFGLQYFKYDFEALKTDKETYGNILSQLSTALYPFSYPALRRSLCETRAGGIDFSSLYDGAALCVSFASQEYPAAASLVYMLIGEQFANLILKRGDMVPGSEKQWRPIVLVMDEFQTVCSPRWTEFFALSREQNCCQIIATQQFESLSREMPETDAMLLIGNLTTRLGLCVGTPKTYELFEKILGSADYEDVSWSKAKSRPGFQFWHPGQDTKTTSGSTRQRPVVDGQVFRELTNNYEDMTFEAVCVMRNNGQSFDDRITMQGLLV
jgi:hypothetical protein